MSSVAGRCLRSMHGSNPQTSARGFASPATDVVHGPATSRSIGWSKIETSRSHAHGTLSVYTAPARRLHGNQMRFPKRTGLHSTYVLREQEHRDVLTEDLQRHFIEQPKFLEQEVDDLRSSGDRWLHMLRFAQEYAHGGGALPEKSRTEEGVALAFDKMKRAQSDETVRIWAESREMFRHDQATRLSGAREEGLKQGLEQGLQEGLERGNLGGRRAIARRLLAEGWTRPALRAALSRPVPLAGRRRAQSARCR